MITYPELFDYTDEDKLPITIEQIKKIVNKLDNELLAIEPDILVSDALTGTVYIEVHSLNDRLEESYKLRIADHGIGKKGWDVTYDWRTDIEPNIDVDRVISKIGELII